MKIESGPAKKVFNNPPSARRKIRVDFQFLLAVTLTLASLLIVGIGCYKLYKAFDLDIQTVTLDSGIMCVTASKGESIALQCNWSRK